AVPGLVNVGIPLDEVLTTKLMGDNPTPNCDDGAKSTNPNVCVITAELAALANPVVGTPPQRFGALAREEKFGSARKYAAEVCEPESGVTLLPGPSAKTPEKPNEPTSKIAVAP